MVNKNNIQFDFDDLLIEPAVVSMIDSRKIINIFDENGFLKIFTAPMFDVINESNCQEYLNNKIYTILPRKKPEEYTQEYILSSNITKFIALGLDEFEYFFIDTSTRLNLDKKVYILIDIANGHMHKLLQYVKLSKIIYKENLVLMVGNIANPDTYFKLSEAGCDFCRCGIGFGCFISGMKVLTDNNLKEIENIEIGDKVLTHTNNYKEVLNKIEYDIDEEIYIINDIGCTRKHEYYVIDIENENIVNDDNIHLYAKWISADDLDENKHLLIKY